MTLKVKLVPLIRLERNYHENSWRCYLATIANYYSLQSDVRQYGPLSSILATTWLLVKRGLGVSQVDKYSLISLTSYMEKSCEKFSP